MNRRIVFILLLLVGGAIVNVAVAWTLPQVWHDWREDAWAASMGVFSNHQIGRTVAKRDNKTYIIERAEIRPDHFQLDINIGTAWYTVHVRAFHDLNRFASDYARYLQSGWPLRSCQGALREVHLQIEPATGSPPLLTSPIWPGFITNTLFYALLLWLLLFAPFAARRVLRRKRRLCEKCAYPVGTSPVCTECGAAVRPSPPLAT